MKAALAEHGFRDEVIERALTRLEGWGYLSDAGFAKEQAAALLRRGRMPRGVQRLLERDGVAPEVAAAAVSEAQASLGVEPALAAARALLVRRGFKPKPDHPEQAAQLLRSRGYSEDVIRALLEKG
jgi:regulatory protein